MPYARTQVLDSPRCDQPLQELNLDSLVNAITSKWDKVNRTSDDDASSSAKDVEERQPESEPRGTPAKIGIGLAAWRGRWDLEDQEEQQPESEPRGTPSRLGVNQALLQERMDRQPESEPHEVIGRIGQREGELSLEDFLPKTSKCLLETERKTAMNICQSLPRGALKAMSAMVCPSSPGSGASSLVTSSRRRWSPNASKPKAQAQTKRESPMLYQEPPLPSKLTTCAACQRLQRQLLDSSAESAEAHTRRHEAMKASRRAQEAHETAEEELGVLHSIKAEWLEKLQTTESELEELRAHHEPSEAKWREEAKAWQDAYDASKLAAGREVQRCVAAEEAFLTLDKEVRSLGKSLEEARWDLEDAQAACSATESRASSDARKAEEEVVQARRDAALVEAAAVTARAFAEESQARLAESLGFSKRRAAWSHESRIGNGTCLVLAEERAQADAEEQRSVELQTEVSEWHQRIEAGRMALLRLQELRKEAKLRLDAQGGEKRTTRISRASSPCFQHEDTVEEAVVRKQLEDSRGRLQALENETEQLRRMHSLEMEKHAAKIERLRLKAERYRSGFLDLQRLYSEQQIAIPNQRL